MEAHISKTLHRGASPWQSHQSSAEILTCRLARHGSCRFLIIGTSIVECLLSLGDMPKHLVAEHHGVRPSMPTQIRCILPMLPWGIFGVPPIFDPLSPPELRHLAMKKLHRRTNGALGNMPGRTRWCPAGKVPLRLGWVRYGKVLAYTWPGFLPLVRSALKEPYKLARVQSWQIRSHIASDLVSCLSQKVGTRCLYTLVNVHLRWCIWGINVA